MDNKIVLIGALLLCSVLLLGCSQPAQPQGGTPAGGAVAQGGGAAQGGAATAAPTQAAGGGDFAGKGYAELVALGVPLQCDVKMNLESAGATSTAKMYFSGGKTRVDSTTNMEGSAIANSVVMKDKKVYMQLTSLMRVGPYANCDWIAYDEEQPQQTQEQASVGDYSSIPPVDFSCSAWIPDDSKFATPGKVCGPEVVGMITPNVDACEGMEGQAMIDCLQSSQQTQ